MATISELLVKVSSNTATALEMMDLAKLLTEQAQEEAEQEKLKKVETIKKFIADQGFTLDGFWQACQPEKVKEKIFEAEIEGKTYTRYEGDKGKFPKWISDVLKRKLTKDQALKLAIGDKGKAFVEKVYD
jgi:hypothetical protein